MTRMAFINGNLTPFAEAYLPITDRGLTMGDGVYEVTAVIGGQLVDKCAHLYRLDRSLSQLSIPNPYTIEQWIDAQQELIARNSLDEGVVYLQVSRGNCERDFAVPTPELAPNVVMFTQTKAIRTLGSAQVGIRVATMPELRWSRRDIKSISLVGAVLGKALASKNGAQDIWFVEDGMLTEGGSSNIFIVTRDGDLVTRDLSNALLGGITRAAILEIARDMGLRTREEAFPVQAVLDAREAFTTSASTFVLPVVEVDGQLVGQGQVGETSQALRSAYITHALKGGRLK